MFHNEHNIQRPFAVVTGASEWFGVELAKQFASKGFDLLISGDDKSVFATREELQSYGILSEAHKLDLSTYNGIEDLYAAIKKFGHPVDALVWTQVPSPERNFLNTPLKEEIDLVRKNVLAPVHLLKKILNDMALRGHGRILITSPLERDYGGAIERATRSFLWSLTETIRAEVASRGVTLTTFLPETHDRLFEAEQRLMENPETAAIVAFDALMSGRDHVFEPTFKMKLQEVFGRARIFISATPGQKH
jgi:short-subunit dehydrogenase